MRHPYEICSGVKLMLGRSCGVGDMPTPRDVREPVDGGTVGSCLALELTTLEVADGECGRT